MLASTWLAMNYAIFALIAIAANISAPDRVIRTYRGAWAIWASVMVGAGVGLVVKHHLDKHYAFHRAAG